MQTAATAPCGVTAFAVSFSIVSAVSSSLSEVRSRSGSVRRATLASSAAIPVLAEKRFDEPGQGRRRPASAGEDRAMVDRRRRKAGGEVGDGGNSHDAQAQ